MRVYELAKELGVSSKELLAVIKNGGYGAASHMAVLTDEVQSYIRKKFKLGESAPAKAQKDVNSEVKSEVSRPSVKSIPQTPVVNKKNDGSVDVKKPSQVFATKAIIPDVLDDEVVATADDLEAQELKEQARVKRLLEVKGFTAFASALQQGPRRRRRRKFRPQIQEEVARKPVTEVTVTHSMLLHEVADLFVKQSSELILALLRKGLVCNRNHVLTVDVIRDLGNQFGINVIVALAKSTASSISPTSKAATGATRWPIVVVMGHVDHGKTTLLDYVRKMNVAATEKGGITQHIRAWEVDSAHGKIVFLDTPGHEAFSYLRQRGSKITDIVVLVVAADDGIKPQTVEAIKHAKEAGVPIIVAVNKIDKVTSAAAVETVKRQLAQQDLMPEDWGGQTIVVPVSAKTGQGIEHLLEMILLQAQLMDLKAETNVPAQAFVLESHVEKGFGQVATVVVKQGILRQGDYFVSGSSTGKVRILINSHGKKVTLAGPSTPVQVVGFDALVGASEVLDVVSQADYSKARFSKSAAEAQVPLQRPSAPTPLQGTLAATEKAAQKKSINLIIKTDTRGSKEAIMDSIDKLIKKHKDIKCPINIVMTNIGDISESDIELAQNTEAVIIGLHVRVEKNAQVIAKERGVDIKIYQIIYEMIDALEVVLLSKKEAVFVWNKTGEAVVKKVFDIKGIGIIAGCYLKDGVLSRGNKVTCVRNGRQIGEAKVTSLQRDRKPVKEIHAGYECGFTADGFNEWQEGDMVVCYAESKVE